MELQYRLQLDGQAVNQAELNTLGNVAGLADDRVFAELLRMTPKGGSVAKGILPYRHQTSGRAPTIAPNGSSGSVLVNPFRAFVGSRTAVGTDALENWRDIRSAMSVAAGDTSLSHVVAIAANASGNPRWDAIFAQVAIDADVDPETRKYKSPETGLVTEETVSLFAQTTCTLGIVTGTPAASPDWPALASDSSTTYYVILGYVRVPNGFGASSPVAKMDIADQAPVLTISHGSNTTIADSQYTVGGSQFTTTSIHTWGSTGVRPNTYLPPCMGGSEGLIVAANLATGHLSLASGDVIDSRDWRNRLAKWTAYVGTYVATADDFPWTLPSTIAMPGGVGVTGFSTDYAINSQAVVHGVGASFATGTQVALLTGSNIGVMADSTTISLIADSSSGALKMSWTGAPNCLVLFWLEFSAPFGNV